MKTTCKRLYKTCKKKLFRLVEELDFILHKNIFVFGAPFHSNLGDQAQTYCIYEWCRLNYPDYKIRIYNTIEVSEENFELLFRIKKIIKKKDYIFLHSGYHTTDLYMLEESMQRSVIEMFPDKRIVLLPQTIFYQTEKEKNRSIEIYNNHKDIVLMCRDEISFKIAGEIFSKCKLLLYPDIVTSMIGKYQYTDSREGILLCMRNDKEAFYSKQQIKELKKKLKDIDNVYQTDTTVTMSPSEIAVNRKEILEEIWKEYSKYKVIITDRYHGTIFALIANTPVIVLASTDHKLSSGVKWFPQEFSGYVQYVQCLDEIPSLIKEIYKDELTYVLPPYFENNFYSQLKQKLEEI